MYAELESAIIEFASLYLADWRIFAVVLGTIMLNFWVIDVVQPKSARAFRWWVRLSSIALAMMIGFIVYPRPDFQPVYLIALGIAIPFVYKIFHAVLLWLKPGFVKAIHQAKKK